MSNAPKPLGLSSFKPRGAAEARAEREPSEIDPRGAGEMDRVSERNFVRPDVEPFERERWPSREPLNEAQINIRAQREDIERFKRLCPGRPAQARRYAADPARSLRGQGPMRRNEHFKLIVNMPTAVDVGKLFGDFGEAEKFSKK